MMKKLLLLSLVTLLTMAGVQLYGQSVGNKPYPGATHTYTVPVVGTNSYTWTLYKGNVSTPAPAGDATVTPSGNSVTIQWSASAVPTTEYLLQMTEATPAPASCQNSVALPIQITASLFDLGVTGGGDVCYTNPVTVAWTGGQTNADVKYTHGDASLVYTVAATGIGATETWSFKPNLAYLPAGVTTTSVVVTQGATTLTADGSGVYTVTGGPGSVTVTVVANNPTQYDNSSSATAQNYTGTLTLSDISCSSGSVQNTTGQPDNADVKVARPDKAVISF